jgi:tripartite-type tricarboxylate transporter receptor subunit TctC
MIAAMVLAGVWATAQGAPEPARAQGVFPTKPIKIVVPVPAGTALDIANRVVAEQLTTRFGQQVLVEPRPGAGGLIAAQAVAAAPADGSTLLAGSAVYTILPAQKDNLPIDVNRDFAQVGMLIVPAAMYVAVSPKLGVSTFAEFVALAKSKPEQVVVGTNGAGTLPHYAGLLLRKKGGIPVNVVPYNQGGSMAAIADIMGGRVHATIEAVFGLRGPLQSGDLRLIGVMSAERDPQFPDVPAITETLPGLTAVSFVSLAVPAATPKDIVDRLNEGLRQALETPSVKQRYAEIGVSTRVMTPSQTTAFIANEQKIWWPLVKELEGH